MTFHEVQFSPEISYGARGGPQRITQIVTTRSGSEQRNTNLRNSIRKYDISAGINTINDIDTILQFWEARYGQLYGFRFKDWFDYKSCKPSSTIAFTDQVIGIAGGSVTTFQLIKLYASGIYSYSRTIKKPIADTVIVGVNGVQQTSGWTVDTTTGIITFTVAPTVGNITAGYEFDVPVRFSDEDLSMSYDGFQAGSVPTINLVELLHP